MFIHFHLPVLTTSLCMLFFLLHTHTHRVNHSKNAIVKPQGPSPSETKREVEEALRKVREANLALLEQKVVVPVPEVSSTSAVVAVKETVSSKKRTRSRSRSRSRSRFISLSLSLSLSLFQPHYLLLLNLSIVLS